MTLWLDGGFWGPWIRREFVAEIEWTRRAVLSHMLPSFPDPVEEADYVTEMTRRLAALILLQPELDKNYEAVKSNTWYWPKR